MNSALPAGGDPAALHAYFPARCDGDRLDVSTILRQGLDGPDDRVAVSYEGRGITVAEMRGRIGAIQRRLLEAGIGRGDRVAVMLSNSVEHVALIYGLVLLGAVWVPVNMRLRGPGLAYVAEHAKPAMFLYGREFEESVHVIPAGLRRCLDDWGAEAAGPPAGDGIRHAAVDPLDTLCIIYTSGTTGPPKGVVFTHRMLRIASEAAIRVADIRPGDRAFMWEPLCHIGGAQMLMLPFLVDAELHLVQRFSASRFWDQWRAARATHLHYLGGVLDVLMQQPPSAVPPLPAIRTAWGAGVSPQAWEPIRRRFGCELRECYGMTECSSFATLNDEGTPGSIGRPLPWMSVELLDDDGNAVSQGEIGEIVLSSDLEGVFLPRYLDNPEATRQALRGGKLHTGDSARQSPDGSYVFVGRRTDSMRVRGENVSAWEVERVFAGHPAIKAAAAVGVAGAVGEQEILLYVQFQPGAEADWGALVDWAKPRLATYQLPRFYQAIEQFDLTPSERIRKHLLPRSTQHAWDRGGHSRLIKENRQ